MLTIEEMKKIVASVSYKPGTQIYVQVDFGMDSLMLTVEMPVIDAIDRTTKTKFMQREKIPAKVRATGSQFTDWIYEMVVKAETHEAREFFRVKDEHWVEPHPEESRATRGVEQQRYMHYKELREGSVAPMPSFPSATEVSLYGFGYKAPDLKESIEEYRKLKKFREMYLSYGKWTPSYDDGKTKPKLTAEGERKKAKRERSPNGKGYSNKPWDALR